MGLHPEQERVSEPPAGEHCVSRARSSRPTLRPVATWQWSLRPEDGGRRTRLLVRQRLLFPPVQRLMWQVVDAVGFVLERRMRRGIRQRAERS
jgi:hypothetical protein